MKCVLDSFLRRYYESERLRNCILIFNFSTQSTINYQKQKYNP